jgi:PPOX class probable F420-dependent enzyme
MRSIPIPATHRDLLDAKVATFATVGPDGRPQLSEIWFLADAAGAADDPAPIRISLNSSRQKTKNLRRNPACTLFVLDPARTSRYLELRCDAVVEPDNEYGFADLVGAKYGADLRVHDRPGESRVVVTLQIRKANAVDMQEPR